MMLHSSCNRCICQMIYGQKTLILCIVLGCVNGDVFCISFQSVGMRDWSVSYRSSERLITELSFKGHWIGCYELQKYLVFLSVIHTETFLSKCILIVFPFTLRLGSSV